MNYPSARRVAPMRSLKLAAIVATISLFALIPEYRSNSPAWAQSAYNPLIAPVPAPSAPAQLPAPVTTAVAPALQQVPALPTPSPTPVQRSFNCSCFGRGNGTHWMGQVSSGSYFDARRAAIAACLTFNTDRSPASPYISSPSAGSNNIPPLAGSAVTGLAANQGLILPGTINFSSTEQLLMCSECTCD